MASNYANEVLSERMRVTPLEEDEIAVYKLCEWGKPDPSRKDLQGNSLPKRPGYLMIGRKRIYDRFMKKKVTISNVEETKEFKGPMGMPFTKTVPQEIYFRPDKLVYVDHTMQETYAFLERVDENVSNPFRNSKVKAWFERVNHKANTERKKESAYFLMDALKWVTETATFKDLKACAENVNNSRPEGKKIPLEFPNTSPHQAFELLKLELFEVAKEDPQTIIKGSTDKVAMIKMQMLDAEKFGIIRFHDKQGIAEHLYQRWYYNDSQNNLPVICEVDPGKNKVDGLLDFLKTKDGQKHYTKIVEDLERVLSPRQ